MGSHPLFCQGSTKIQAPPIIQNCKFQLHGDYSVRLTGRCSTIISEIETILTSFLECISYKIQNTWKAYNIIGLDKDKWKNFYHNIINGEENVVSYD